MNRLSIDSHVYDFNASATQFALACLRASLQMEALEDARRLSQQSGLSWAEVRTLAQAERIAPLLYCVLRGQTWIPTAFLQELRTDYIVTAGRNTLLLQELERLITLMASAGFPVIPLKGAALIETFYPTVAARPMFDLDILVKSSQASDALALLERNGYERMMGEPRAGTLLDYENEITLVKADGSALPLEVHWSLIDSPYYQRVLDMDWFWGTARPARIGSTPTLFLSREGMLLHLCAHLALHHRGAGLLWLHDVALLLQHEGGRIDWGGVVQCARRFGLTDALRTTLTAVRLHWQASLPDSFLAQLSALPIGQEEQRALEVAATPPEAVARRFLQDVASLPNWRQRSDFVMRNLFPTPAYMRWRYGIAHRWLTPFYYPYRWALGLASALRRNR